MSISRREICSLLPLTMIASAFAMDSKTESKLASHIYNFDDLPVEKRKTAQVRAIFDGFTATGEHVEVHATILDPGGAPHPPHHHRHSEMWLVREGTIEITINGKTSQVGPGSVAFVASGEEHGIHNPGKTPASYFVVAIGTDPA